MKRRLALVVCGLMLAIPLGVAVLRILEWRARYVRFARAQMKVMVIRQSIEVGMKAEDIVKKLGRPSNNVSERDFSGPAVLSYTPEGMPPFPMQSWTAGYTISVSNAIVVSINPVQAGSG